MYTINLIGAAGVGKSLNMSGLTYHMKKMGLNAENTPEFIKEMIYEESKLERFGGQLYILAEQNRRIARLQGKADFIITDCPLALIASYTKDSNDNYIPGFEEMAVNLSKSYQSVNYFLRRNEEYDFENENRFHTKEQSDKKSEEIYAFLKKHDIPFTVMMAGDDVVSNIIDDLLDRNIITQEHLKKSRTPSVRKMVR